MKHHPKIDGLRAVAVGFVLLEHFADKVGRLVSAGYYGVDLFFVISGFLITGILLGSRGGFGQAYGRFVGRRTLRIFPAYYILLAVLVLLGHAQVCTYLAYFATYTFNYAWVALGIPMGSASHLWSLAVEEQFYLLWPFLVLSQRSRPRLLLAVTGVLVVASFVQLVGNVVPAVVPYDFVGLFPRAGSLGLGAMGAILLREGLLPAPLFRSRAAEFAVLAVLAATLASTFPLKPPVLALCSLFLVLKAAGDGFRLPGIDRLLGSRPFQHVGGVSYGVYLYHLPIGFALSTYWVGPWLSSFDFRTLGPFAFLREATWIAVLPAYTLISVAVATLSHRWIERPILSLKDRWFPR